MDQHTTVGNKEMYKDLESVIKVGNTLVGENQPVFFIAEIGNNHNGDYFLAKRSIEEAVKAGANAVKLQKRFLSEVFTQELLDTPQLKDQIFGKTYGEYRRSLELNEEEFVKLKQFAEELGVMFFATPFDKMSADFLENIGVEAYKIASFDLTNKPLLEYVAKKGKPMFMSVGMANLAEIDEAVETILQYNKQLIILHCVSIYPTPDDKLHLSTIPFLKNRYDYLTVGYSGHEQGILGTLAAVTLGAKCVERHFTLDKSLPGPDHATVSITPEEFQEMVEKTRRIEKSLGLPVEIVLEEEQKARNKHSKSLVTKCAIPCGSIITVEMLTCKSPGHGIKPYLIDKVIGKTINKDLPVDVVITEDCIIW